VTPLLRKFAYAFVVLVAGSYAVFALRGPQGIPALMEKWEEVRRLEQENAVLQQQIREKKERIGRLKQRPDELELEIRKETMQVKPGEKILILPEPAADPAPAAPPAQP
jgi:cell division protein FtsB